VITVLDLFDRHSTAALGVMERLPRGEHLGAYGPGRSTGFSEELAVS
jgi:hypothetical protein